MRSLRLRQLTRLSIGSLSLLVVAGCPTDTSNTDNDATSKVANRDSLPGTPVARTQQSIDRFPRNDLTYFINNVSSKLDQGLQEQLIADAFSRWSAVTPLNFTRVQTQNGADIVIGFGVQRHCELYAPRNLDCPSRPFEDTTIGHANFPIGPAIGQLHMNEAFDFSDQRLYFSTMVHEIGHNLGIDHIAPTDAVMFANDNGQTGALTQADIDAAQRLYGSRDGSVRPQLAAAPPASDEAAARTAPKTDLPDADGDGIDDATEQFVLGTNPDNADTDGDGLGDGVEAVAGLDARSGDTDGDGTSDGAEFEGGTNAFRPDFASTGDVSALVGAFTGSDSLGATLSLTIAADGSVAGTLALKMFGFDENLGLSGAVSGDGTIEFVSNDYYFDYQGTVAASGAASGTFTSDGGLSGTWTATRVGGTGKALRAAAQHVDLGQYAPRPLRPSIHDAP
ncbi:MAG: matrixin family metalloprotease [Planctomycetes bacterium]|nr:matrixin family metalloprotease [Planctomycetota bacterium]